MMRNPRGSTEENHDTDSDDSRQLSRRAAVGAIAAAVGGGTVLAATTGEADAAEVTVDELRIDDATFEAAQVDPVAEATVAYEYRYDAPSGVVLTLDVEGESIAEKELMTSMVESSGTETLTGHVVDAPAYDLSAFETAVGETITREVTFGVGISVQADGSEAVSDRATETAVIEVTNPDDGNPYARIGGEITIRDGS